MQRKAIVTIVHGERYQRIWRRFSLPNWRRYAARHGYELLVLEQPLDTSLRARSRSIAWQKLLVAGHPNARTYDVLVWMDADVVINPWLAPCIASSLSTDQIGVSEETELPREGLFAEMVKANEGFWQVAGERLNIPHPLDAYRRFGFPDRPGRYFNTGVMVLRPALHRDLLQEVYDKYEDKGPYCNYEQVPLSYEIETRNRCEVMDPKYNVLLVQLLLAFGYPHGPHAPALLSGRATFLARLLSRVYFLHFAGVHHLMPDLALLDFQSEPIRLNLVEARRALSSELAAMEMSAKSEA